MPQHEPRPSLLLNTSFRTQGGKLLYSDTWSAFRCFRLVGNYCCSSVLFSPPNCTVGRGGSRVVAPLSRVVCCTVTSLESLVCRTPIIPSSSVILPPPLARFIRDLEGVVDALKRVTDKLRGENDRLRRMAGDGGGRAEAERSAREAKRKAVSFFLCSANQTKSLNLGFHVMSFDSRPVYVVSCLGC